MNWVKKQKLLAIETIKFNSQSTEWLSFLSAEIYDTLNKCSSSLTPGPDHISWYYLKKGTLWSQVHH